MVPHPDALPDSERAYIPDEKLLGYALNPQHGSGKHKARVFASILGFTLENAAELKMAVLEGLGTVAAVPKGSLGWGQVYEVDIPLQGPKGAAIVRTSWIIDRMSDPPRMTSIYVLRRG